jgi:hypothetical protein
LDGRLTKDFEQEWVEIIAAVVAAEFGFLEMQAEPMSLDTLHPGQAPLGVTDIDEAMTARPAVAVDAAVQALSCPG